MKIRRTKADALFSRYVRIRDRWKCRACGKQYQDGDQGLHCAHIFSRRNWATRHDPSNAIALCYSCHMKFTGNPVDFTAWCTATFGQAYMDDLGKKAHSIVKKSRAEEGERVKRLKALCDE